MKTIVPKHATKCKLGQRDGFSDTDIRKINTLYQCRGYPQVGSGATATTTPKPTTPKPWVKPSCVDSNKHCAYWASTDECKKNPSWMLTNCPVACDQCGNKCVDNNQHCDDWAGMGECGKNPEYMNSYCAKVTMILLEHNVKDDICRPVRSVQDSARMRRRTASRGPVRATASQASMLIT